MEHDGSGDTGGETAIAVDCGEGCEEAAEDEAAGEVAKTFPATVGEDGFDITGDAGEESRGEWAGDLEGDRTLSLLLAGDSAEASDFSGDEFDGLLEAVLQSPALLCCWDHRLSSNSFLGLSPIKEDQSSDKILGHITNE